MMNLTGKVATAVVLAGGYGTRLRSVVQDMPKPMAPVAGRPFVEYILAQLATHGVETVVLAVGYLGEQIEQHFGAHHAGLRLLYSYEHEPLGTGGAVRQAFQLLKQQDAQQGPVLVMNGDSYFAADLTAFAKTHHTRAPDASLALRAVEDASRYGLVEVDVAGRITHFREKQLGASGLINAGIYLLDPQVLLSRDLPQRFSLETDFFQRDVSELRLLGQPYDGYFIDIGIPQDYARAQTYFSKM